MDASVVVGTGVEPDKSCASLVLELVPVAAVDTSVITFVVALAIVGGAVKSLLFAVVEIPDVVTNALERVTVIK